MTKIIMHALFGLIVNVDAKIKAGNTIEMDEI